MECLLLAGYVYLTATQSNKAGIYLENSSQILFRLDQTTIAYEQTLDHHIIYLKDHDSQETVQLAKYNPQTNVEGQREYRSPWYDFNIATMLEPCASN